MRERHHRSGRLAANLAAWQFRHPGRLKMGYEDRLERRTKQPTRLVVQVVDLASDAVPQVPNPPVDAMAVQAVDTRLERLQAVDPLGQRRQVFPVSVPHLADDAVRRMERLKRPDTRVQEDAFEHGVAEHRRRLRTIVPLLRQTEVPAARADQLDDEIACGPSACHPRRAS